MGAELAFDTYLAAVQADTERLGDAVSGRLGDPVPSCPEWSALELVDHVGQVFGFWATQVRAADPEERHDPETPPLPVNAAGVKAVAATSPDAGSDAASDAAAQWLHDRSADLLAALREAGAASPAWNWSGSSLVAGWVARRMALEVAIHRFDGELVSGDTTPIPAALAADGLDERINVHLATDVPEIPEVSLGGSLCLACTDVDSAFVVEINHGTLHVHDGPGPASAFLRGTASDLFLFSWNRLALSELELTGDADVAAAWASLPA